MTDFSQELKKDFLDEAFDLLDGLEKSLLALENDTADEKAVNEVFRSAHTIKGGAGTVGFTEIQELTHLLEDVLDMVRKKTVALGTSDITLLLSCRDELEKMLSARAEDRVYSDSLQEQLKEQLRQIKLTRGPAVAPKKAPAAPVSASAPAPAPAQTAVVQVKQNQDILSSLMIGQAEVSQVSEALGLNKKVFALHYRLNEAYEMKDVSGFQIYALMNDISEIIRMKPTIQEMEVDFYPDIYFLVATDRELKFIEDKTMMREIVSALNSQEITQNTLHELENRLMGVTAAPAVPAPAPVAAPVAAPAAAPASPEAVAPAPVQSAPVRPEEKDAGEIQKRSVASLRVESWKIDELLNLLGELVITKATFTQLNAEFDRSGSSIKSVLKDFLTGITKLALSGDAEQQKEKNMVLLEALTTMFNSFDIYSESIQKLNRISSSLQENVMNMRMVPIQMVFSRFPRLIRDMADKLSKKIELTIEGVETEIDKGMVDDIFDPLIHILRNAVDHGIELPAERAGAGKNETGRIVLKALHEGDSIVIEVTDDGGGIDVEAIKRKAIENGFLSREAADRLSQKELLSLIFLPGLSTAKQVSDLSGRGVGMDVVKKKIEEIGGTVALATVKGKGTKIVIRLPLTLAIIQGLLIVVNDMHYVIPVASVEETVIVNIRELQEINGRLTLELRGKFIPVMSLKKYFYHDESAAAEGREYCIVAKFGDSFVGILVSEVIGEQDIVIKPLNTKLIKSAGISAATIIGNGDIGYIIDTAQIISQYFKNKTVE